MPNQPSEPLPPNTYLFHLVPTTRFPTAGVYSPTESHLVYSERAFSGVIAALDAYPGRRFTIGSNLALFQKWYEGQTQAVRARVKKLVENGSLEFVDGGWVNADQACPSWEEILANIVAGHRFLSEAFGVKPKHAWAPS